MRSARWWQCLDTQWSLALAAAILVAAGAPALVSAESTLRLEAEPSSPGGGNQQVTEPVFQLSVINTDSGNGDTTAYRVQLLVSVINPSALTDIVIELGGMTTTITSDDLAEGTPEYACSGRSVPPHGIYPAYFTAIDLGDILANERVDMSVSVSGDDGVTAHFEAIGEGLRQQGNSTVCRDVSAPSGHHVTAVPGGGGSLPDGDCAVALDKTSDVEAVTLGGQVEFTLTAVNTGDCELSSVVLTDLIPILVDDAGGQYPAFTVIEVRPEAAAISETEIVWAFDTLAVGDSIVATITAVFDQRLADGLEVVNAACVNADELDDRKCDNSVIAVGDVVRPTPIGGPGFWCQQIRASLEGRSDARFTTDELAAWLSQVNDESWAFTELYDTSTLDFARTLLCRPSTLTTASDRMARHLLALSLNLESGRIGAGVPIGQLCPGSEQPPEDTDPAWTVGFVRDRSGDALVAGADDETLRFWMEVIDFVGTASSPEACATTVRRPRGPRRLSP